MNGSRLSKPSVAILDVGHGNSAVLLAKRGTVVVDTGRGSTLVEFLAQQGVRRVDLLLLSHADSDHVGGALTLLLDERFKVGKLYHNPDVTKRTKVWKELAIALRDRLEWDKSFKPFSTLTSSLTGELRVGGFDLEVLHPHPEAAFSGPGGVDYKDTPLTSNLMSGVVRIFHDERPVAVLAGDADDECLDLWDAKSIDARAPVLVFPHHGGRPAASEPRAFTRRLCERVKPDLVVFSIHHSIHKLPRPEVVDEVRRAIPNVRVLCTQLSGHCRSYPDDPSTSHLVDVVAAGLMRDCCAGTVVVGLDGASASVRPKQASHARFLRDHAPTAMCRRGVSD